VETDLSPAGPWGRRPAAHAASSSVLVGPVLGGSSTRPTLGGYSGPYISRAPLLLLGEFVKLMEIASSMAIATAQHSLETPPSLLSVHTLQSTVAFSEGQRDTEEAFQPPLTPGERARASYPNELAAAESAYDAFDIVHSGDHYYRLLDCRTGWRYMWNKVLETTITIANACGLRWCPQCAKARANWLSHQVRSWYKTARKPKLLTLTLRHSDEPLKEQVTFIYRCFRRLRLAKFMSSRIRGGIWFLQIKWMPGSDGWHPHIHALLDAEFIDQPLIKARWAKLTKGSDIVDIRPCYSPDSAAHHVARYATRPGTLTSVPAEHRLELLEAVHGRKIVGTWGTAKTVSLSPPKAQDKDDWMEVGSWKHVHYLAQTSAAARAVILSAATGLTVPEHVVRSLFPQTVIENPQHSDRFGCKYLKSSIWDPL